MGDIKKYYENTSGALPNPTVKKFIDMNVSPSNAIDLGCGAGRDTIFLIKNGWNVLSIDRENTKEIISNQLDNEEIKKFRFKTQNFEDIKLEKTNLLVANFSIPFCNKEHFNNFWKKITDSILKNGYFVGNFFGVNDAWAETKKQMVFLTKEQVLDLFKESFEIIHFNEIEKDGKTGLGKMKHWHIYNVIAKRVSKNRNPL